MVFDDKYSDNVSLSKILDCFLSEGEEPSVIFSFLSKYSESEIIDIFSHSTCIPRMFCLGFLYRCSDSEKMKMISYTTLGIPSADIYDMKRMFSFFLWQILRSKLPEGIKSEARKIVPMISTTSKWICDRIRHPYSGIIGKRMSEYDYLFIEHPDREHNVIKALGKMSDSDFSEYVKHLDHSLWFMRMLQMDVFESLDIGKQYIFVQNALVDNGISTPYGIYFRFFRQLMESDVDVRVKMSVYGQMKKTTHHKTYLNSMTVDMYDFLTQQISNEEMVMQMQLYGVDNYSENVIIYHLLKGDEEFLTWMYDNCPEIIRESVDISDLIEEWKRTIPQTNP